MYAFGICQVKFHIISHQKLLRCREESTSLVYLNMEQLVKILTSLYDMYSIERQSNEISLNQGEFYSFYVLLCLGRNNQKAMVNTSSVLFILCFLYLLFCWFLVNNANNFVIKFSSSLDLLIGGFSFIMVPESSFSCPSNKRNVFC